MHVRMNVNWYMHVSEYTYMYMYVCMHELIGLGKRKCKLDPALSMHKRMNTCMKAVSSSQKPYSNRKSIGLRHFPTTQTQMQTASHNMDA